MKGKSRFPKAHQTTFLLLLYSTLLYHYLSSSFPSNTYITYIPSFYSRLYLCDVVVIRVRVGEIDLDTT